MNIVIAQIQAIANNLNRLLGKVKITDGTDDVTVNADGSVNAIASVIIPNIYKAGDSISVTTTETEINLGSICANTLVANTGTKEIVIKFNSPANDGILLNAKGSDDSMVSMDMEVEKIYHRTTSGTSTLRYIATGR